MYELIEIYNISVCKIWKRLTTDVDRYFNESQKI